MIERWIQHKIKIFFWEIVWWTIERIPYDMPQELREQGLI